MNRKSNLLRLSMMVLTLAASGRLATAQLPSIRGTAFLDANGDGRPEVTEALEGVELVLIEDDGDGFFDAALDVNRGQRTTGPGGAYEFSGLDPAGRYFLLQPAQVVADVELDQVVTEVLEPGRPGLLIDDFQASQSITVNPIAQAAFAGAASSDILGGQRDLHLQYLSGSAEAKLRVHPYGLSPVLQLDSSADVVALATVTWDGVDADFGVTPALGLGGIDLTQGGLYTAFALTLGVDSAGETDQLTLKIFSGASTSTALVDLPLTDGTAAAFTTVPFTDFVGGASLQSVDAIQLVLGGQSPSVNAQVGSIGLIGPLVRNVGVSHTVVAIPEPAAWLLIGMGVLFLACFIDRSRTAAS